MKYTFIIILMINTALGAYAQKDALKIADKYFQAYQYATAANLYEKIIATDSMRAAVARERLVVCYKKLNDPVKAEGILAALCAKLTVEPKYIKMYADALAENSKYDRAAEWYGKYISINEDAHAKKALDGYSRLSDFYRDSAFYKVEKVRFNSEQSDFSPAYYKEGIAFCSARNTEKSNYAWDNSSFIDLYWVNDMASEPVKLDKSINSSFHEGPATFTRGYDTLFFTRNNYINSKKSNSKDGVMKLKVFYAVMQNGLWTRVSNMPFNSDEYSVGHPTLAPDHKLYFVSDMPGGLGGTDIYYTKLENGKWIAPVNVGAPVNSAANEMFPFVSVKGDLFFASNGHGGLGGLDIFKSAKNNGVFESPKNMGYPINTSRDDFGLITTGDRGYFSSNRGNNPKDDNIFAFAVQKSIPVVIEACDKQGIPLENFTLSIVNTADANDYVNDQSVRANYEGKFNVEAEYKVTCKKEGFHPTTELIGGNAIKELMGSKAPLRIVLLQAVAQVKIDLVGNKGERLAGGTIWMENQKTNEIKKHVIESGGPVTFEWVSGVEYELTAQHSGFKTKTQFVSMAMLDSTNTIRIELVPNEVLFEKNEIGQIIELDIKYDLGKANIRQDAARELNKLVDFLTKNPTIKVELGSHTDVRGTEQDNLKLSQWRAESCVQYIVKKGIGSERLIPLGYGEDDLKVQDAVTEEEHQLNRRTTVKIVGM